jgi:predicted porin
MKKALLALAVLAAFAGTASAQTNVTMYGVLDMALQHENDGVNSTTALDSGIQSGSRLGFKGTEDLGGGLKANFDLEAGVNADTGTSSQGGILFGRQAWVGLSGGFGSLRLGRQ